MGRGRNKRQPRLRGGRKHLFEWEEPEQRPSYAADGRRKGALDAIERDRRKRHGQASWWLGCFALLWRHFFPSDDDDGGHQSLERNSFCSKRANPTGTLIGNL
jgi:hypothetical protein